MWPAASHVRQRGNRKRGGPQTAVAKSQTIRLSEACSVVPVFRPEIAACPPVLPVTIAFLLRPMLRVPEKFGRKGRCLAGTHYPRKGSFRVPSANSTHGYIQIVYFLAGSELTPGVEWPCSNGRQAEAGEGHDLGTMRR